MERLKWEIRDLLGLSGIYWQTCTLHAAVRLGLFSVLGDSALSADEIARLAGTNERATETLCNALTAMGLLIKEPGVFHNSDSARKYLVKEKPGYIGHMIMHHHHLVEAWAKLHEAVTTGKPVRKRAVFEHSEREAFLMGMFTLAMGIAPRLADELDLSGKRHLLDLGGGPGSYAIQFCLKNQDLKATVFDMPETRPFAEETIARFGLQDRITFQPGDYLKDPILGTYDVAWLSHIMHGEGPDACLGVIKKAVRALRPGGIIMIHEFILDETMASPLFPAIFSLNMLVATKDGKSYSEGELGKMLLEAGAGDVKRLDFKGPNDSGILKARV